MRDDEQVIQPYEIGRLVFVKTSAWLLSRDESPAFPIAGPNHATSGELLLRRLLETLLAPGGKGRAWLCDVGAGQEHYEAECEARNRRIGEIEKRVMNVWRRIRERNTARGPQHTGEARSRELGHLQHRVFLDSTRLESLLDGVRAHTAAADRPVTYYVLLDLRFFHLLGQLRCHASVSVWSAVPRHPAHRPDDVIDETPQLLQTHIEAYRELFERVATEAEGVFRRHGLVPVDGAVGDGAQGLPVFWVVLPDHRQRDPMDYLRQDTVLHRTTNHLAQTLLTVGDVRDYVVSHSVLNGTLLTLRRPELREDRFAVPRYLMIPGGPRSAYRDEPRALELDIATTITTLSDLEAESASRLLAVEFDLEIWRNHVQVYNAVAERAAFLWDALSTHLPIRRGWQLGRVHRAVELLHQMLLQGVADLGHIANLIRKDTATVAEVSDDVSDRYNARITERHRTRRTGLAAALTETGLAARARREAREIAEDAERVKTAYADLLGAMAHAFDERRVREFDVLQRFNFLLGAALGAVGVVTVLEATVLMTPPEGGTVVTLFGGAAIWGLAGVATSWAFGLALFVISVTVIVRTALIGQLGSRRFRALYDGRGIGRRLRHWSLRHRTGVWQMLRHMSTDTLERRASVAYHDPGIDWDATDRKLARRYAAVMDEIRRLPQPHRNRRAAKDIKALSTRIEQWGMHSLLLTERPRRMYRYPLPVLTCLFRTLECVGDSGAGAHDVTQPTMIAYQDFSRALGRLGFTDHDVQRIDDWLTGSVYRSADEALRRVEELRLGGAMTDEQRRRTLRHVNRGADRPV